jgi:DNA-binding response OmpR family regulator
MPHILLIDDDEFFRGMVSTVLKEAGHKITEAGDGREGLRCHATGSFDLVITDLIMPGKEGIETILELRRRQAEIKIIAISGGGRESAEGYLEIALNVGADHVLAKPFRTEELLSKIADTTR